LWLQHQSREPDHHHPRPQLHLPVKFQEIRTIHLERRGGEFNAESVARKSELSHEQRELRRRTTLAENQVTTQRV
jgi:hypothetical protein